MTTNAQVRKLMETYEKSGKVGVAAMRAGMHRNTARKYLKEGALPSDLKKPRSWRTRKNPFAKDWDWIVERLTGAPELEAKTLFEALLSREPERYQEGQLRTLQRRIKQWRAQHGPEKNVFFSQEHRPGEAIQTDFTEMKSLKITLAGEAFEHLLCHSVLPYSNWEWATPCFSESLAALRLGVQNTIFRLGRVAKYHQTDNSTAATHRVGTKRSADEEAVPERRRPFNDDYRALMRHLGMTPRTIEVGKKEQNGDVEASHRALKSRLNQHLLLRGSRDFESRETYEKWLHGVLRQANRGRKQRFKSDLEAMRPLAVNRLAEYVEETTRVSRWSTIRVKGNSYSVWSRLIGEQVRIRLYEDRLEVHYGGEHQLTIGRLLGSGGQRIDYRHFIWSLVKKPGALARYRFREELFPSLSFRRAHDRLHEDLSERSADLEYLRVLHLAASTLESDVETALELLLEAGTCPDSVAVRRVMSLREAPEIPEVKLPAVDLDEYDALLAVSA